MGVKDYICGHLQTLRLRANRNHQRSRMRQAEWAVKRFESCPLGLLLCYERRMQVQ
jgi:hypothetical protein